MMQHCQQVFAELNSGSVSVGGGGVPRTMIAGQNPYPQQYPQQQQQQMQQQQMQPQQGFQSSSAPQAKTMIAQQSPFAGGQMPQQQQSGLAPQQQQGGFVQSSPMQKTIVAGMAPPIVGGQMQGMPGQMGMHPGQGMPQGTPGGFPQQMQQQQQPGMGGPGPNKTVLLQPTDGIVSVAPRGGAQMQARGGPQVQQGASTLFWIVSLVIGVAIGVLGYVIVLQM
jgi:hypothetical protein